MYDGFAFRESENADIQEAPDDSPNYKKRKTQQQLHTNYSVHTGHIDKLGFAFEKA